MPKLLIPTGPDELLSSLTDGGYAEIMADPQKLQEFVRSYASAEQQRQTTMREEIATQVQSAVRDLLTDRDDADGMSAGAAVASRLSGLPVQRGAASRNRMLIDTSDYNKHAIGAKLDSHIGDWNFAQMACASWHNAHNNANASRLREQHRSAMADYSGEIPALGGLLVPESIRTDLIKLALEDAVVRGRAFTFPMDNARVSFPAVDDTSHAGSVLGGITAYWSSEGATFTESEGSFASVTFDAKKLVAAATVPNELIQDALPAFNAFLSGAYPAAMAWYEDLAFLAGSGVGEPLGVMNAPAVAVCTKQAGQAAATIVWENIAKMYSRMLPGSLNRAVWIVNPDTFSELATMALSVGTGGSAVWLSNGVAGPPMTILGRPVYMTEKVSSLGTQGDIGFYDLSYYGIGDRQTMEMSSSPHYRFTSDRTVYRVIMREDGRPLLLSALTPRNGSNTQSAFVQLETRS
jgi:HK97 family phage major capsid protein